MEYQKKFNPKYGDIIVCENGERYICASAEEVLKKVKSDPRFNYPDASIYAYREGCKPYSFMTWDSDGCKGSDGYSIKEVISMNKKQPHKHAELIKAWADGAEIQYFSNVSDEWENYFLGEDVPPLWYPNTQYRIKPEPKPDIKKYIPVGKHVVTDAHHCNGVYSDFADYDVQGTGGFIYQNCGVIEITIDGETGDIKSVQLVKQ